VVLDSGRSNRLPKVRKIHEESSNVENSQHSVRSTKISVNVCQPVNVGCQGVSNIQDQAGETARRLSRDATRRSSILGWVTIFGDFFLFLVVPILQLQLYFLLHYTSLLFVIIALSLQTVKRLFF
jgi:hypothetical protein